MDVYKLGLLHAKADRAFRGLFSECLRSSNITMMEWLVLGVIINGSSKNISMSAIANELNVTLPQITALVNGLLHQKMVKQRFSAKDRRTRLVIVTSKGNMVYSDALKLMVEDSSGWFGNLSEDDINAYIRTMQHFTNG